MRFRPWVLAGLLLAITSVSPASAKVVRVEFHQRELVLGGKIFGDTGAYERITGRMYFRLDVKNRHNHPIVDLENAENLTAGEVEFWSDFVALRPSDPNKGNGSLILEVPNRGHSRLLSLVDGGDWDASSDAGDAWILRKGFSFVSLGWQWDAAGQDALHFGAPIAREKGATIKGMLRGDIMPSHLMEEIPLGHLITGNMGGTEYPVSAPEDPRNALTVRASRDATRKPIPRSEWQFAHTVEGKLVPSDRFLHLKGGFKPGLIYEYVYVAEDPRVAGGGFAAVRDFASYAKHAPDAVTPAKRVIGQGISQNGRFLRDFLYQGFNADEEGRKALDGVLAHVAGAGRGSFNYRFAQPSRDAQPTSSIDFPTDIFPFTDLPETDPLSGERRGLLDLAVADGVVPQIFLSNTSYEYWGRAASLITTSPDGKRDVATSDYVRIYHLTGLQHFSVPFPPERGKGDLMGQQPESPLPVKYFWRAMIANMDAWIRSDIAPPEGRYPHIADGTLVPLDRYAFPHLPGVNLPHEANAGERLDFGPSWKSGILSTLPPRVGPPYPVLVPQVDEDGNEKDGVRLPELAVPLATYAPWNLRDASIGGQNQRVAFEASWIPFARTSAERKRSGDPRRSIEERYVSREDYLTRYAKALDALIVDRWILPEDREQLMDRGRAEWDFAVR